LHFFWLILGFKKSIINSGARLTAVNVRGLKRATDDRDVVHAITRAARHVFWSAADPSDLAREEMLESGHPASAEFARAVLAELDAGRSFCQI
jgi:acyl-[acyl carrier protein]--UDP-N-acetylglucosamine O-acyltransferase